MNDTDQVIAEAILDINCDGSFDIEIELGNNTLAYVCGNIETSSYQEDDYFKGTGAWVTTYASVSISNLELCAYNDDGDEIPCNLKVDESEIEKYCKQEILRS